MTIIKTDFEGLFVLVTDNFTDNRGSFQKLYNFDFFKENQLDIDFKEFYYSVSRKNVPSGMFLSASAGFEPDSADALPNESRIPCPADCAALSGPPVKPCIIQACAGIYFFFSAIIS